MKPLTAPVPAPHDAYLQTSAPSLSQNNNRVKKLRDYKPSEITRELPAVAAGSFGIVYKGKVKVAFSTYISCYSINLLNLLLGTEKNDGGNQGHARDGLACACRLAA